MHSKAVDVLEGRKIDTTFYPVVYSAPDDADWTSEELWKTVCPSLDKTVTMEFMRKQCESAKQDSAEEMNFRQFFLCQWVYSAVRWLPMDKYDLGKEAIDMDALKGRKCYGGLDLASTNDIAAFVLVFPPDEDTETDNKYIVLPFFWIPFENIRQRVKNHGVHYDKWVRDGFLQATEGNVIDYAFIEQKIMDLRSIYEIQEVAFDDWGATQMIQRLSVMDGIEYIAFRQGYKSLSPPSKELMRLVLDGKIQHGGHPVLRWMFNNVFIESDAAGNIKPSKQKSSEKIDGAVSTIMALDRAQRRVNRVSVYYGRCFLVFGGDGDW
jgi:phage terminase large subunit-like protein